MLSTQERVTTEDHLTNKLITAAQKTISFLESKLKADGSYDIDVMDISCYFKSPMLFVIANKPEIAKIILRFIELNFMQTNGDFKTKEDLKSSNNAYKEYWCYTNGWILRAANILNVKNITEKGFKYFEKYSLGSELGFSTNEINSKNKMTDILTVAHHGLINLEAGNMKTALACGVFLCNAIEKQPNLKEGFFLRFEQDGKIITKFSEEEKAFYFVSTTESNQLHFMIGYPAAFLAILYENTNDKIYLDASKKYLDFSLNCKAVHECDFSHKIAWAASFLYEITGDVKYLEAIDKISEYFIKKQSNGMWFLEDTSKAYDQSAEIACWFLDLAKNIKGVKKTVKSFFRLANIL